MIVIEKIVERLSIAQTSHKHRTNIAQTLHAHSTENVIIIIVRKLYKDVKPLELR